MDLNELRAEFSRLAGRWLKLALLYGIARVVAFVCCGLAALYVLDRSLALPAPVRIVLLLVVVAGLAVQVYRGIVYPLKKRPTERDVACAIERRFPQFDGRLLAVLELEGEAIDPQRNVSPELVADLRRETSAIRATLPLSTIFEYRHLQRLGAAAAVLVLGVITFVATQSSLADVFFRRLLGGSARWPQRTMLAVKFPEHGTHYVVEYDAKDSSNEKRPIRVRIARGASLPVAVTANGENPELVEVRTESRESGDSKIALSSTGNGEWAGRFRSVRAPFTFRPVGGDDDGGGREVEVEIFTPPAVASVTSQLQFPAYTGLGPRVEPRGDVEGLVGTHVTIDVQTADAVAAGRLVFDSGIAALPLLLVADSNSRKLRASFDITQSCAYSIELVSDIGFKNLEPPTYSVLAVKDRGPTVRVLEPGRADVDVTPNGIVPLRIAADDDYGLTSLAIEMKPFGGATPLKIDFPIGKGPDESRRVLVYEHLDLKQKVFEHEGGPRAMAAGESLVYRVAAKDNFDGIVLGKDGKPSTGGNETAIEERRVDIVAPGEKQRLLAERQTRTKEEVGSLRALQQEKIERLEVILKEFDQAEGVTGATADDVATLEVGQNQVTARSLKQCREFAEIFEEYLFNRLDTSSGVEGLIAVMLEKKRGSSQLDGFDPKLWRPLVEANAASAYGRLEILGRIFEMIHCVIDVAELHSPAAAKALSDARLAVDPAQRPLALRQALEEEKRALERLDALIARLDEWESFQEIVATFRNLVEDQRSLNQRTKQSLKRE